MKLLPSPKELGFSSNYALQSELLHEGATDTWEAYRRQCKKLHPVKYALSEAVEWLQRWPRVKDVFYWLRTHTYNRYHILDLREAEVENKDGYKWGWIDRCEGLLLANFLVLREFVEKEHPWSCKERIEKLEKEGDPNGELPGLRRQQQDYEEVMSLYNWWIKDRFAEYAQIEEQQEKYYKQYMEDKLEETRQRWIELTEAKYKREEEQLIRLAKLRGYLWT